MIPSKDDQPHGYTQPLYSDYIPKTLVTEIYEETFGIGRIEITPERADVLCGILRLAFRASDLSPSDFYKEVGAKTQMEYRSKGSLGFGGKFWNRENGQMLVSCYQDDETEDRLEAISAVNAILETLSTMWQGVDLAKKALNL